MESKQTGQTSSARWERVQPLDETVPETVDQTDTLQAWKFLRQVKRESQAERAVFNYRMDTPMQEIEHLKGQKQLLNLARANADTPIMPIGEGGIVLHPPFTEPQQQLLAYTSSEIARMETSSRESDAAAARIIGRLSGLRGLLAQERDAVLNDRTGHASPAQQVRRIFDRIETQRLGSKEDAIVAIQQLIDDTGIATSKDEIYMLVTRIRTLLADKKDFLDRTEQPAMILYQFRPYLRSRLGTDTEALSDVIIKALAVVDLFEPRPAQPAGLGGYPLARPAETNDESIERLLNEVITVATNQREITRIPAGGHSAIREAPATATRAANAATTAYDNDIAYRAFMAGVAEGERSAGASADASQQRTRREQRGTMGPGWKDQDTSTDICHYFQRNQFCRYGDKCRFAHVPQADTDSTRAADDDRGRDNGGRAQGRGSSRTVTHDRSRSRDNQPEERTGYTSDRRPATPEDDRKPATKKQPPGTPEKRRKGGGRH